MTATTLRSTLRPPDVTTLAALCVNYCSRLRTLAELPACDATGTDCAKQIDQAGVLLKDFRAGLAGSGIVLSKHPLLVKVSDNAVSVFEKNRAAACVVATKSASQQTQCARESVDVLNAVAAIGPTLQAESD